MPVAVISNLNSRRNRRQVNAVRSLLADRPDVLHVETRSTEELPGVLTILRDRSVRCVALNGGDGSAQIILTHMLNGDWPQPPCLAVLPGGTTNMTAHDLNGGRLGLLPALRSFLSLIRIPLEPTPRPLIRVQSDGQPDQYGFFFGMGAVVRGIQFCHERVYTMGLSDELAPGVALLRAMYGIARREPVFAEGLPMTIRANGCPQEVRASILAISTLERLFLGMTPFWGTETGALAVTLVRERPHRLLRTLPALLRGRPNARLTPDNGYSSRRTDALTIATDAADGQFTLDGEIFPAARGELRVSAAGPLHVLPLARQ